MIISPYKKEHNLQNYQYLTWRFVTKLIPITIRYLHLWLCTNPEFCTRYFTLSTCMCRFEYLDFCKSFRKRIDTIWEKHRQIRVFPTGVEIMTILLLHRKEMSVRWLVRIDNCSINMKLGWFDSHCSRNKHPSSPPSPTSRKGARSDTRERR